MSLPLTGTASVTNGTANVVVTGFSLTDENCTPGAAIVLAGVTYFVKERTNTTTLVLNRSYTGTTSGSVACELAQITPDGVDTAVANARLAVLLAQITDLPMTRASAAGPGSFDFYEDTDNGSNRVRVAAPSSLTADRSFVLPDANVTMTAYGAGLTATADAAAARTALGLPFIPASASGPASLDFAEDTDNGVHRARLQAVASLAANRDLYLPDATGTLIAAALSSGNVDFSTNNARANIVAPILRSRRVSIADDAVADLGDIGNFTTNIMMVMLSEFSRFNIIGFLTLSVQSCANLFGPSTTQHFVTGVTPTGTTSTDGWVGFYSANDHFYIENRLGGTYTWNILIMGSTT